MDIWIPGRFSPLSLPSHVAAPSPRFFRYPLKYKLWLERLDFNFLTVQIDRISTFFLKKKLYHWRVLSFLGLQPKCLKQWLSKDWWVNDQLGRLDNLDGWEIHLLSHYYLLLIPKEDNIFWFMLYFEEIKHNFPGEMYFWESMNLNFLFSILMGRKMILKKQLWNWNP